MREKVFVIKWLTDVCGHNPATTARLAALGSIELDYGQVSRCCPQSQPRASIGAKVFASSRKNEAKRPGHHICRYRQLYIAAYA
jgi:hypothetical protein